MAETKAIDVNYPTGRELLNAYWGLLANGGLVITNQGELHEGDKVAVQVTIESSQRSYSLNGHVVRVPPQRGNDARGRERVVIAFDAGQPQDLLLDAAWAETENAPTRRDRRYTLDVDVRYHGPDARESRGRLVNVSHSGCCLRVSRQAAGAASVGEALTLLGDGHEVPGVVRWAVGSCRGIEFQGADSKVVEKFVKQFI